MSTPTPTLSPPREGFTFKLISDWEDKEHRRQLRKGMGGEVVKFNDHFALVSMQGLDQKCTVPRQILKGGSVKWNTWTEEGGINKNETQYIRLDAWHQRPASLEVLHITNFRSTMPTKANWNPQPEAKDMQQIA